MSRKFSIADARNNLARLVHQAEDGEMIELTRRGKPVAVVLSIAEFRKLAEPKRTVWDAISEFRRQHDMDELDIDPNEIWGDLRDPSAGREFKW